ncbi:MAG: hypothetical protein HETSPECPRED_003766 [Heterodermia speciosa]|uniref:Fe2OG dioxygenase domain-containing protein n=1 Tax=Heterodermia speciosa TaxID=116794 RepID=A0A8H3F380_9LECA|nr:MAG: hypothetical protein HETSPECPRED_003766 [Heterodermia speciosa]
MSFDSVPILDLARARDPDTKPTFLSALRDALLTVGFFYIKNTGIDDSLIQDVVEQGRAFFDLPQEEKLKIQMKNTRSCYSLLGAETTAKARDFREQIDISTPHPIPSPSAPLYHNLLSPNQWPSPTALPSFRPVYETYLSRMSTLSTTFTSLIAESLLLPPTAFNRFFDTDQQHKVKIVKYPDVSSLDDEGRSKRQGVGPHKDSMLTSYLLQASAHRGLQAQNLSGDWIDVPPIPGTLVVAIGQGLEALTHGVCKSTTHRVLSPPAGSGPRYSVPFFQGVSYDSTFESVDIPEEVLRMRDEVVTKREELAGGKGTKKDDVEFAFKKGKWGHLGEATLVNRIRSHPDVGERWYPEILEGIRKEQRAAAEKDGEHGRREEPKGDNLGLSVGRQGVLV